ncbi:alpha-amylase family protein [Carnobacterium maltaromaticum]|uniref:alpha-amylase family protein n=1 Tax=Carnobacterium maltaromaticum TaxID=2751 RepID=UPI0012F73550|nr:beta-galactosidase trimerization domain-containing protein [Carnobacterium maltaromaticum]
MDQLATRQIHLDFHTPNLPFQLGKQFNKKEFQQTLVEAAVNSVTLTGRCHHGHIYYDTKMPARHPQMQGDFLVQQIDACHEIGIKAPVYLTVGWDAFMADTHPEWLERKSNGEIYGFNNYGQLEPGWKTLCFNTPYLDYLKEQIQDTMQHLATRLDGLFFDIVWQDPCCCNSCIKKMRRQGLDPTSETDRSTFARETEIFLKSQIYQTVQAIKADCPIFFNEGNLTPAIQPNLHEYSHLEIESLPSGEWGYQHFPTVVRYAKNLGKEYLGMTGKFHKVWADFGSYKNKAALEYECFLALAHGAKCSIGDQMYPDGTLQKATYQLIGSVYQQVQAKEAWSLNAKAVTEIAILHPGIVEITNEKVDLSLAGAVNSLNEAHYQFDIIDDLMEFNQYRLLILPDKITLNKALAKKIDAYLAQGGKIVATYQSGLEIESGDFPRSWGISYLGENRYIPTYGSYRQGFLEDLQQDELVLHGPSLVVEAKDGQVIGEEIKPMYNRTYEHYFSHFQAPIDIKTGYPVATLNQQVAYFSHPLFSIYKEQGVYYYKQLILTAASRLLEAKQFVKSNLPSTVDVVLNHQAAERRFVLTLLHYIPERRGIGLDTIEEALPLANSQIRLEWQGIKEQMGLLNEGNPAIIKSVTTGNELDYQNTNQGIQFELPYMNGHEIIEIVY